MIPAVDSTRHDCYWSTGQEECAIDLAFAVDGSGSIEVDNPVKGNWDLLIGFLTNLTLSFDIGTDATRVAMVKFDERSVAN